MTLHKLTIAALLMCSLHAVRAADSSGSFAVKGVGLSKCSDFVDIVKGKEPAKLSRYVGWISGYISASNQHATNTFDLTLWQDIRTLTLALVNHCDRNADMRFGEAVVRMTASLAADRLDEKSELVPIEHDGQTLYLYKEAIRRTQTKLSALGMYSGDVDGQFNDATKQAVSAFQIKRKLPATGVPEQKTMFELMRKSK